MIYINIHSLESAAEKRQLVRYFFINIFTARKRNLRRLCFYTCLSVHRGEVPGQVPPGRYTPLGRYSPPSGQVHPSPPLDRSPLDRSPSRAGTPPRQAHPPGSSACWEIWATSLRYASYWNAYLLEECSLSPDGFLRYISGATPADLFVFPCIYSFRYSHHMMLRNLKLDIIVKKVIYLKVADFIGVVHF